MAISQGVTDPHWIYLLALENDLEQVARYVELTPKNYPTFSIEIARVLMSAGAEIDVVCKQLCKKHNPASSASKIHHYRQELSAHIPRIGDFEVEVPRYGLSLNPWEKWKMPKGVPDWWTAVNKTKHQRHSHYQEANLKNALNAVAGLFVITLYLYREKAVAAELKPTPRLLRAGSAFLAGTSHDGYDFGINYNL